MFDENFYSNDWWAIPLPEVFSRAKSGEDGLTEVEARARLKEVGPNVIDQKERLTRIDIFLSQFQNPLIIILLVAGFLTLGLGDFHDTGFIFGAVLVNTILGFYQENKAERALRDLETYLTRRVRAIRGGKESEIDASELVPGDLIHLSQGDRVPADARVISGNGLFIDESILTGESLPIEKFSHPAARPAGIGDRYSMVYSGTLVAEGAGEALVVATDQRTELGKIAVAVSQIDRTPTPLQSAIGRFSLRASFFIFAITAIIFGVVYTSGISLLDSFLIAIAILVASVPEGLPVVLTMILAIGVQRLAKKNGIVRKLSAAETLGSTSIILTDKTGTLTQAKMALARVKPYQLSASVSASQSALLSAVTDEVILRVALLNSDAVIENPHEAPMHWRVLGKPLEAALIKAAAGRRILLPALRASRKPVHFLPFSSRNKFSASVAIGEPSWFGLPADMLAKASASAGALAKVGLSENHTRLAPILSIFGAPEILLRFSNLDESRRQSILKEVEEMAHRGERVVAVAAKVLSVSALDPRSPAGPPAGRAGANQRQSAVWEQFSFKDERHLSGMTFLGTISFRDPLRPGVRDAFSRVAKSGVRTIIVTGDHEGTTVALANEMGLAVSHDEIIDGSELDALTKAELRHRLKNLKIVSRVSPEGKLRILKAFREAGEIVAMNGDGINDAPALHEADIGVAMGSGTDVAKDVSDLILLDDNYETIVEAIHEGRRILDNIRKAIVYLSSTVLDEVFLIGGSLLLGLPLPLGALQILWVNFFTDSFPGLSLAFEEKIDSFGSYPKRISHGIFNGEMKILTWVNGVISSFLLLVLYVFLIGRGYPIDLVKTFVFGAFATYSLFLIFAIRSLKKSVFSYNPFSNLPLVGSVLIGLGLTLVSIYAPFFQKLFGTVALPASWLLGLVGFGILNILLIEITKSLFQKRNVFG